VTYNLNQSMTNLIMKGQLAHSTIEVLGFSKYNETLQLIARSGMNKQTTLIVKENKSKLAL
jgi:hypothetical protein